MGYAGYLALNKEISMGEFTLILLSGQSVFALVGIFKSKYNQFLSYSFTAENLFETLDVDNEEHVKTPTHSAIEDPNEIKGNLVIEDLSAMMPFDVTPRGEPQTLFENLTLHVKQGEIIGIIGAFGTGKSTLLHMITGFNKELFIGGNIQIDGISVLEISKKLLIKKVALIPQNLTLMPGTIEQNLVYGVDSYSEEKLEKLLDMMGASILYKKGEQFPDGLQTVILKSVDGKPKIELNEYQKAVIVLVQALIKEPKILLLDEFFGHIVGNEIGIEKCLRKLNDTKKLTIIMTTKDNNASALKFCNRVYVLDANLKTLRDIDVPMNKYAMMKRQFSAYK